MEFLLKLIIFLPLISGIINGVFYRKITYKLAGQISIISMIIATISAITIFFHCGVDKHKLNLLIANWINLNSITINWTIYVDQLTSIMFLLVTIVSTIVHVYSLGYMSCDKSLPKFLSYLSLFTFFMLALVSADNFLQLFFGWEGVGLCSYLLIGYYYQKESACNAAIKAFMVNRVSDFGFIIGIIMIIIYTNSIDFNSVFLQSENLSNIIFYNTAFSVLDIICLMLFIGCMGKSAQIGMHVWLPDAMEGPTPVSALIHAATMVTAGVFLIARCSFMFEYSPLILQIITIIGAITCLFAAFIAIAQTDIKKIIAYSTCSQLGYMFFACGVSAYQAAIFHLVTHGFFKALLFLSAGSVIHACHKQDIFSMGNLRQKMPITYTNFWLGSLAIIGIYPFAGFYSKDLILESAYLAGGVGYFAFIFGILAAFLTAVYSLKIIILVFHGETNLSKKIFDNINESDNVMNVPLLILSFGALFSGMIGYYILNINNPYGFFLDVIFKLNITYNHDHAGRIIELLPFIIGIVGIIVSSYIYIGKLYNKLASRFSFTYHLIRNQFFIDEIYNFIFIKPIKYLSLATNMFDVKIIDNLGPGAMVNLVKILSDNISKIQTGYIFNYTLCIISSVILCITLFIVNYLYFI